MSEKKNCETISCEKTYLSDVKEPVISLLHQKKRPNISSDFQKSCFSFIAATHSGWIFKDLVNIKDEIINYNTINMKAMYLSVVKKDSWLNFKLVDQAFQYTV